MMAKWLTHTLVLAFAYILAGRLGQLLAVPPNYATAVWPASGIALAGLLLLGSRVWPGIFLGAWVVNGWVLLIRAEDLEAVAATVKSTTSIACGVTLQALAAYLLIRWLIGHPNALTRERDILGFLALGGPLACLIGATWGVATLYLAGSIDRTLLAMNWWTWWVGDVIGVVIFTPLALICFARPRDIWQPRRLSVALPLCVTFVVTTLAFFYAQRSEMSRFEFTFERRVREVLQAIQERLAGDLDAVHSVKGLYASSVGVERTEFATFNEHLLSRHIGVQAMEWLPRVSRGERSAYEARARAEGLAGFAFTERDAEGELVVAGERDEYYPVFYVEPLLTNESAIGFDLASDPKQRRALELARDSGRQVASAPVTLVPKNGNRRGFRIFDPIYAKGEPLENVRDRRRAIQGFVLGVFRIDEIVEASQPPGSSQEFQITMTDVTDLSDQQVVYSSLGEGASEGKADQAPIRVGDIGWSTKLVVAEREWRVDCTPTASFFAAQADAHTWLILSGGLAFTGLLGTFLLILSGRTARVEELVAARTGQLQAANKELAQEIAHRKGFERALSKAHEDLELRVEERTAELTVSEARYLDLYNNAPDMFISVDVATQRVTECNQTFLTVTGYDKVDVIDRHVYDLYHRDCLDAARRSFRLFLTTGKTQDFELLLLRADGNVVEVSMNVSAVRNADGQLLYSRAVLRDITAKKRAEARIKRQEVELAHVSRLSMMGEMATGLAHEINQPLAAIAAYAEGAAMRLRGGKFEPARLARVVDRISADAHRAGEVIRRLRQFVRKREPDRTKVELNELVKDVAQFVATDARQRQIKIRFHLEEDLPPLQADPIEIQQVILNLIRNGCDAMEETAPANRLLVISTRRGDEESVEVDVEDRGHGLSEDMEEQVFEAFFSSKGDGLGMGLAISRSIIESHGGRIWVTPNFEGGATFHFSLPAAEGVMIDEQ